MGLTIKSLGAARRKNPAKFNRVFNKASKSASDATFRGGFPLAERLDKKEGDRLAHRRKRLYKLKRAAGASAKAASYLKH